MRFLACLELYKQGLVDVMQFQSFGEFLVRRLGDGETVLDGVSLDDWDDSRSAAEQAPGASGKCTGERTDTNDARGMGRPGARSKPSCSATTEPIAAEVLAQLVELPVTQVDELCAQLAAEYEAEGRGFVLARVAGGYRFQTHPDLAPYVERFVLEGQHARLSGPSLETLAIIAYKQPISRGQVSAIRGVNVEGTVNTLLQRGYVQEVGRDPGPGAAVLYGTTPPSSNGWACTRSTTCRRSATSCPTHRWSKRSSAACT